jgi:hypothetical protein
MNESDVITMGLKEDFQCSRRTAAPKGDARQTSLSNAEQSEAAAEGIVKIPQRASGFDRVVEISR